MEVDEVDDFVATNNAPTPDAMDTDDDHVGSGPDLPFTGAASSSFSDARSPLAQRRRREGRGRNDADRDSRHSQEQGKVIVDNPTLDLDAYISGYQGRGKINRLLFIAAHAPSLAVDALVMAEAEIKSSTISTSLYKEVVEKLQSVCKARNQPMLAGIPDQKWIERTEASASMALESLNRELSQNRNKALKQYIVIGQTDLGDFYFKRGDWSNALKSYLKTRDYSCNNDHLIQMCENTVKTYVQMNNWSSVLTYAAKAEAIPEFAANPQKSMRMKVLSALSHLHARRYELVADILTACTADPLSDWATTVSLADIGTYGGLCALATWDRASLQRLVLNNVGFKHFLENVPIVRELVRDFYHARYASCFKRLNALKPDILLDVYLSPHVTNLYQMIREKALVQYFRPFLSTDLTRMAEAFETDVPRLTDELSSLIIDGQIDARVDYHNKILQANSVNHRDATFQKALDLSEAYQTRVQGMLLRVAMQREEVIVRMDKRQLPPTAPGAEGKGKERAVDVEN